MRAENEMIVKRISENKLEIKLPEEVVNTVQRAAFEYETYRDNIAFLLDTRRDDESLLDSPNFKRYCKLQAEAKATFELAKQEVEKMCVPADLAGHRVEWNLDYATQIVTLTVKCECGIAILNRGKGEK